MARKKSGSKRSANGAQAHSPQRVSDVSKSAEAPQPPMTPAAPTPVERLDSTEARARSESSAPASTTASAVKVELAIRPVYVMDDDEGNMRIEVLEEVVNDLKLELDGYRAATRELAIDLEKKERALEAKDKELADANGQGRERAIAQATAMLEARLEKAERAVERERGDGDAGRAALVKLRALEAELERRMLAQDESFELKWKTRVDEAHATQEAFRMKLAALEQRLLEARMGEEHAKDELARVKGELVVARDALRASSLRHAPTHVVPGVNAVDVVAAIPRVADSTDATYATAPKRRGGFFSFIAGSDRAEPYAGPKHLDAS